ncbi:hypothetical protein JOB18_015378 [Solea senegalensis]|uniref:Uncharacterized protein n=1 Tax=Solea senegalensis TaxID=28829 RepID=A0AAV6SRV1_SOLSE|nr:hypothetical protein JOB18_015378 [Solea senegalensis]
MASLSRRIWVISELKTHMERARHAHEERARTQTRNGVFISVVSAADVIRCCSAVQSSPRIS